MPPVWRILAWLALARHRLEAGPAESSRLDPAQKQFGSKTLIGQGCGFGGGAGGLWHLLVGDPSLSDARRQTGGSPQPLDPDDAAPGPGARPAGAE